MSLSTRRERSTTAATRLQEKPCEGGPAAGKTPREGSSRLAGGDLEDLGRHADGTLDAEVLVLGPVDEVVRDWRRTSKKVERVSIRCPRRAERKKGSRNIHFSRDLTFLEVRVLIRGAMRPKDQYKRRARSIEQRRKLSG